LAAVQERTRLARDLHDSAAQTLFGLTLSAEAAARALGRGEPAVATVHLRETQESARRALAELRLLVFELRPAPFPRDGLAASLRARLEAVEGRAGLGTDLSVEGDDRLPAGVEAELDRIAQEALNNVIKHAGAGRVAVHLRQVGPTASLVVVDDGAGFDPAAPEAGGGLGLRGMAERAARIGGTLEVAAGPGKGTRVAVEVPR
jgi:signal transduction histidine kinase